MLVFKLYFICFKKLFYDLVFKLHISQLGLLGLESRMPAPDSRFLGLGVVS